MLINYMVAMVITSILMDYLYCVSFYCNREVKVVRFVCDVFIRTLHLLVEKYITKVNAILWLISGNRRILSIVCHCEQVRGEETTSVISQP